MAIRHVLRDKLTKNCIPIFLHLQNNFGPHRVYTSVYGKGIISHAYSDCFMARKSGGIPLENEAVRELSRLTDKELSDIGLHRGTIRAAVKNSL